MAWKAPREWQRIETIDAHTEGEPLRVICGGFPQPPGETILAKRRYLKQHHDDLRRALMWEPRGHADMYGCLLTPPVTEDGDVGVLFLHNEGYSTMCGHGIIGLVKVGLECGLLSGGPVIEIDTPAGRVTATAHYRDGRVDRVSFENVPAFVFRSDLQVEVEGLGTVSCQLVFGGAFYAYVDAPALGLRLEPSNVSQIIDWGRRIKQAVAAECPVVHPTGDPDLNFLYGAIFVGPGKGNAHSRNVCVFAEGEVDRSPTGTGVSGRAALHYLAGELELGRPITIESLIGSSFEVEVTATTKVGRYDAVITRVSGRAFISGRHQFLIDPQDPFGNGFLLR